MNPCKFVISTNFTKDPEGIETWHIASYLQERGARVWLLAKPEDEVPAVLEDMERMQEERVSQMDLVIVDAVITRGAFSRMLSISVKINGRLMDYFQADGMIVATPTGSTGYNLSAGGPIVVPYARGILITPICPRSLTMRSIVVSETDEINFEVLPETMGQKTPELMLTVDGQQGYPIVPGDQVFIEVDPVGVRLTHMENTTFFDTLRKKMFKEL